MAVITMTTTGAIGAQPAFAMPMKAQDWPAAFSAVVNFSGNTPNAATGTVTLQFSNDPNANPSYPGGTPPSPGRWNAHPILANLTGDNADSIVFPVAYVRLFNNAPVAGVVTCHIGIPDQL